MKNIYFFQLIQARIEELLEYQIYNFESDLIKDYSEVLLYYLKHDDEKLEKSVNNLKLKNSRIAAIAELRFQIRKMNIDLGVLELVMAEMKSHTHDLWKGEFAFVAAMAYEQLRKHPESRDLYYLSHQHLDKGGASRKAIKALQNYLAEESRVNPHKSLIPDYHYVYMRAKKLKDYAVAAMSLSNISREYQIRKAYLPALKFANKSIAFAEKERGSRCFYLTLAHRSHIYWEMGRAYEARKDYEEILAAEFLEVKSVAEFLNKLINNSNTDLKMTSYLPENWKERIQFKTPLSEPKANRASVLEEQLIQFLSQTPRDKFEIIENIYGHNIDFMVSENRLKNLLNRLRKKYQGRIVFENGKYHFINDSILQIS